MTNDIPQIDDLIKDINDSDFFLGKPKKDVEEPTQQMKTTVVVPDETTVELEITDNCWNDFMGYLESADEQEDKSNRLVCKLDCDLADSLDDCNIHN